MTTVFFLLFIAGQEPATFTTEAQCLRAGIESYEDFACRKVDLNYIEPEVGP